MSSKPGKFKQWFNWHIKGLPTIRVKSSHEVISYVRPTFRCRGSLYVVPYVEAPKYLCELLPNFQVYPHASIRWFDRWEPVYPKNFEILGIGPW